MTNILHRRLTCSIVLPIIILLSTIIFATVPAMFDAHYLIVNGCRICAMFHLIPIIYGIGVSLCGAELDMIDLSKPHSATLVKTTSGTYCIEICRFPFWSRLDAYNEEKHAIERYNDFVEGDKRAAKLRAQSGVVRVITTPYKKAKVTTDDFEHIANILNQYAPDKVKAIRDLQAVYNSDK